MLGGEGADIRVEEREKRRPRLFSVESKFSSENSQGLGVGGLGMLVDEVVSPGGDLGGGDVEAVGMPCSDVTRQLSNGVSSGGGGTSPPSSGASSLAALSSSSGPFAVIGLPIISNLVIAPIQRSFSPIVCK